MVAPLANVPQVAGVPPLNFASGYQAGGVNTIINTLLTQSNLTPTTNYQMWGIFQSGQAVIATGVNCDSCVGFEIRKDYTLADYPIEGGSFETYDKVSIPFIAKVRFSAGFSPQTRSNLLSAVDSLSTTFLTYQVVTPEFIYTSANVSHYDYKRESSRGVGLLVVDVWVTQILVAASTILANGTTQNPASSAVSFGGVVGPQTLTPSQSTTLSVPGAVS
jgi:hypothetical protein